ncbi:MAG: hypothetical protein ACQER7_08130 [Bacteroidota bacterium]
MSLKQTQALIKKVNVGVNMKNSIFILVILAILTAFPASKALSQEKEIQ